MTSISPMRVRKLRPTMASPRAARKSAASDSARAPSSIALGFVVPPRLRLSPLRCPPRGPNSRLGSALRRESVRRGFERDESTITIDRELALSHEDMPGAELDMAGRAVERELRRRIRHE